MQTVPDSLSAFSLTTGVTLATTGGYVSGSGTLSFSYDTAVHGTKFKVILYGNKEGKSTVASATISC